jgi:transposase
MKLFPDEPGQAIASGAHGIVLMDKAGWHTAGDRAVPKNLSLVFLPPYSPELNPIERLWLHLRENCLSHCVFRFPESLCSYPWLERISD